MNVSLTPELDQFVKGQVESGLYHSASEVVRDALRLLMDREQLRRLRPEELRRKIALGIEQLEHGQYVPLDEVFRELRELKDSPSGR